MGGLKKFIQLKFGLRPHFNVELFRLEEALPNEYTLMDVAYIYAWRRVSGAFTYFGVFCVRPGSHRTRSTSQKAPG